MSLKEYLEAVKKLTGSKIKMSNVVTRSDYENKSVKLGRWLTLEEYENTLKL